MTTSSTMPLMGTSAPLEGAPEYRNVPMSRLQHALSREQVRACRKDEFLVIRNQISVEEAAFFRAESDRLCQAVIELSRRNGRNLKLNLRLAAPFIVWRWPSTTAATPIHGSPFAAMEVPLCHA